MKKTYISSFQLERDHSPPYTHGRINATFHRYDLKDKWSRHISGKIYYNITKASMDRIVKQLTRPKTEDSP